jgi:hypothetical protein
LRRLAFAASDPAHARQAAEAKADDGAVQRWW